MQKKTNTKDTKVEKGATIDDVVDLMQKMEKRIEKNTDNKIDDLAGIMQRGFSDLEKRLTDKLTSKEELQNVETNLKVKMNGLENMIDNLSMNTTTSLETNQIMERLEKVEIKLAMKVKA